MGDTIAWERAESRRVAEEERNVPQFANGRVVYDCVSVVEMETVVKMVRVGREEDDRQQRAAQNREELFSAHIRLRFKPIRLVLPIQINCYRGVSVVQVPIRDRCCSQQGKACRGRRSHGQFKVSA